MSLTIPSFALSRTDSFVASTFGSQIFNASIFDPQIFNELLSQIQPGAILSEAPFQAIETILDSLPDNPGCRYLTRIIRSELDIVRANGMVATETLAQKVELTRPYIENPKPEEFNERSQLMLATKLKRFLGLRDSGRLPPAARLAIPRATGRVEDVTETNAIARYLQDVLFTYRPPVMPANFQIDGHIVTSPTDPVLAEKLVDFFGEGVTPQILFNLIRLVPGFTLSEFAIKRDEKGLVTVWGTIKPNEKNDIAAIFYTEIPARPSEEVSGDTEPPPWTALGKHFFVDDAYRDNALGTGLLLQFAAFLRFIQLDGLDAPAQSNGRAFWASKGFEPRGHNGLVRLKSQFAGYLETAGLYSEEVRLRLQAVRDLSQIAAFSIAGQHAGYDFLANHSAKILPLRFQLRPNYFGWLRLIPMPYPIEWGQLSSRVRESLLGRYELQQSSLSEIMLSDQKEGIFLSNWLAHEVLILQRTQSLGHDITEHLNGIVEVLNMVHRLKGQNVWHYFMDHVNWLGVVETVQLARSRGMTIDLEIPKGK